MKGYRRFILSVFLGALFVCLTVASPALTDSGVVRFYDLNDLDDEQVRVSQGGQVGIEVVDSDLDVVAKFEGSNAESIYLHDTVVFELRAVPVADRNNDGFVNRRDITVRDMNGKRLSVYRAGEDGLVELEEDFNGTVMVSYWGAVVNNTGIGDKSTVSVKSKADPVGFTVTLHETRANSGVFRQVLDTNAKYTDPDSSPPILRVAENDVITLTYEDEDPARRISVTLKVEPTPPDSSDPSPTDDTYSWNDPISSTVRFYIPTSPDHEQEWVSQGGRVGLEVSDSDLDVAAKFEGGEAESHMVDGRFFELMNVPVADRNDDGFVNRRDITVLDENGNYLAVYRAAADGTVELADAYTGMVMVNYWAAVINDTGIGDESTVFVKSQADPTGIRISVVETSATSGVFRGMLMTTAGDSDESAMTLKVGKNDVIRLTYQDEDPERLVSATLKVEPTPSDFSNLSPASDVIRFYVPTSSDDEQESVSQGGRVGLEVADSDLDVVAKFEGSKAESITLWNTAILDLKTIPVADRNDDGFVNRKDVTVLDANGNELTVYRAGSDGSVYLDNAYTGMVMVSYWATVINDTGMGDESTVLVRSQADPTGIRIALMETSANSGVFRGMLMTTAGDSDESAMTLKVGKNDVIRLTYQDEDPERLISATLKVESTALGFSNLSSASGVIRFYDLNDLDDEQEWVSQGGQVGLEVADSDLDVAVKLVNTPNQIHPDCDECVSAEFITLNNQRTFYLSAVPVLDSGVEHGNVISGDPDGFINRRDVLLVDEDGVELSQPEIRRVGVDGRVDLLSAYTGSFYAVYWGWDIGDTGDLVSVRSQADPVGFTVTLRETRSNSGVFRLLLDTHAYHTEPESSPPVLRVGRNDVITLTYEDEDPERLISARLKVESTPPDFSNLSPAHNFHSRTDPIVEFDVRDNESGIADESDIRIIFAVDRNSNGIIDANGEYEFQINDTSRGDVSEVNGVFTASLALPSEVEVGDDATIYWWALARDVAGNLGILDRQPRIDGRDNPCFAADFPRGELEGANVNVDHNVAGCQPYTAVIDNTGPVVVSITTGRWWDTSKNGDDKTEYDSTKARNDSILVVFSEDLDPSTVQRTDFRVDGEVPMKAEVFDGREDYVFLTVSPLSADAQPEVDVRSGILDVAGNHLGSGGTDEDLPNPDPPTMKDSFELLVAVLRESEKLGTFSDVLGAQLTSLFVENMIVPVSGETPETVEARILGMDPALSDDTLGYLIAVADEARRLEALSDAIADLLSSLLIERLIIPTTGESLDEATDRLSAP